MLYGAVPDVCTHGRSDNASDARILTPSRVVLGFSNIHAGKN